MTIYDTARTVLEVLVEDTRARNSYNWLVVRVWMKMLHVEQLSLFTDYDEMRELPSTEAITRAARKLVKLNPQLGPDASVAEKRRAKTEEFRLFATGEGYL